MKRIIIIMAALIAMTASKAQELKTYSGHFKSGEATYTYYENDEGRVFEGEFCWKGPGLKPGTYGYNGDVEITGNFKNNKRDGLWVYTRTDNKRATGVNILKVNYIDGVPEGKYEYEETWGSHTLVHGKISLSTSMKNGRPNGSVKIECPNSYIITGEYTQGTRTGVWKKEYPSGSYYHIVCNGSSVKTERYRTPSNWDKIHEKRDGNFFYNIEDGSKNKASEYDMMSTGGDLFDETILDDCWELETLYSLNNFYIIIPKEEPEQTAKVNKATSQQDNQMTSKSENAQQKNKKQENNILGKALKLFGF